MKMIIDAMKLLLTLGFLSAPVSCQLKVIQPSTLVAAMEDGAGTIEASLGNFGHIMYGSTMFGAVITPTSWDPEKPQMANNHGCTPLSWGDFPDLYSTETQSQP